MMSKKRERKKENKRKDKKRRGKARDIRRERGGESAF